MKLFLFITFCCVLSTSAETYSQSDKVNLDLKNVSVYEAVNEIANQTNLLFILNESEIDSRKKVTVKLENASLDEAMTQVLRDQELRYDIVENYIVLAPVQDNKKKPIATCNSTRS